MIDFIPYFLILCMGFGLGALFTTWQTRVEHANIDDDEFDAQWRETIERNTRTVQLSEVPANRRRADLN